MNTIQEILKTKMCRDTTGIVMDYVAGNKGYWKGEYKSVLNEFNNQLGFLDIEGIIYEMKSNRIVRERKEKSNDFKRHIGTILSFHFKEDCMFEMKVVKITDKNKLVLLLPNGKKKFAKIVQDEGFGAVIFNHQNHRFIFSATDPRDYLFYETRFINEYDFIRRSFYDLKKIEA